MTIIIILCLCILLTSYTLFKKAKKLNDLWEAKTYGQVTIQQYYKKPVVVQQQVEYDLIMEKQIGVDLYAKRLFREATYKIADHLVDNGLIEIEELEGYQKHSKRIILKIVILK